CVPTLLRWAILVTATEGEHLDGRLASEGVAEVVGQCSLHCHLGRVNQLDPCPGLTIPVLLVSCEPARAAVVRLNRIEVWTGGVCPEGIVRVEVAFRRVFDVNPGLVRITRDAWQRDIRGNVDG